MLFRSSQIWLANYRNNQVGYNIPIDISNIKLYGPLAYNYQISNFTTISGLISKRYLYTIGIDKNYDRSMLATVTISNIVGNDYIQYFAQYDDYLVNANKNIYVALSGPSFVTNPLDVDQYLLIRYSFDLKYCNIDLTKVKQDNKIMFEIELELKEKINIDMLNKILSLILSISSWCMIE